jgi:hypothetical protein
MPYTTTSDKPVTKNNTQQMLRHQSALHELTLDFQSINGRSNYCHLHNINVTKVKSATATLKHAVHEQLYILLNSITFTNSSFHITKGLYMNTVTQYTIGTYSKNPSCSICTITQFCVYTNQKSSLLRQTCISREPAGLAFVTLLLCCSYRHTLI